MSAPRVLGYRNRRTIPIPGDPRPVEAPVSLKPRNPSERLEERCAELRLRMLASRGSGALPKGLR